MMNRILIVFVMISLTPDLLDAEPAKKGWGSISVPEAVELSARRELHVEKWPADESLPMPIPFPNIVRAWIDGKEDSALLNWSFNKDATEILVLAPGGTGAEVVHVLTAEESGKQADGTIVLSALDAKVVGKKVALESHPGNHRIGFWIDGEDYVTWDVEVGDGVEGKYDVELVYSRAGGAGATAVVKIGGSDMPVDLRSTGTWYVYQVQPIGEVEIGEEGRLHVEVRSVKQSGAVMNLKAVILFPKAG